MANLDEFKATRNKHLFKIHNKLFPKRLSYGGGGGPIEVVLPIAFKYEIDTSVLGYEGIVFNGYDGNIFAVRVVVDTAPTSDATFDVNRNGVSVYTATLPSGETDSCLLMTSVNFLSGDDLTIVQTDPQDAVAPFIVYLYANLA